MLEVMLLVATCVKVEYDNPRIDFRFTSTSWQVIQVIQDRSDRSLPCSILDRMQQVTGFQPRYGAPPDRDSNGVLQ